MERIGETFDEIFKETEKPSSEEIAKRAEEVGKKYGRYVNWDSKYTARNAKRTAVLSSNQRIGEFNNKNLEDRSILNNAEETIGKAIEYLYSSRSIALERCVGKDSPVEGTSKIIFAGSEEISYRLALMLDQMLFPAIETEKPKHRFVYITDLKFLDKPQIFYLADENMTFVLACDYTGEAWKAHARNWMWSAERMEMFPMHAGVQFVRVYDEPSGKFKTYALCFFGLSKTGKTTRSCHTNNINMEDEEVRIVQDDITVLDRNGSIYGTGRQFYAIISDLDPVYQELLYNALMSAEKVYLENATFEDNELVLDEKKIEELGGCLNPRAVLNPENFTDRKGKRHFNGDINTPPLEDIDGIYFFFITRDFTITPYVTELSPEETALAYILGKSVHTPATTNNQELWWKPRRTPGTDPFTPGDPADRANWLYRFCSTYRDKVRGFLINTGGIGGHGEDKKGTARIIEIQEMTNAVRGILRGAALFMETGLPYFSKVLVSAYRTEYFQPWNVYGVREYKSMLRRSISDDLKYLEQFGNLDSHIRYVLEGSKLRISSGKGAPDYEL